MGSGLWATHVLAGPLFRDASLAADVAPGPTRILVRVPAVVVVAGAGLGERLAAALRGQPVEAAETRRGRGLVLPVQVAVVPEAACEEEEPTRDPECGSLAPWAKALGTSEKSGELVSCP